MFVRMACPSCGENGEDMAEPRAGALECPLCGAALAASLVLLPPSRGGPSGPEEDIADWLGPIPRAPVSAAETAERTCLGCGYEGPMVVEPGRDTPICPACGRSQYNRNPRPDGTTGPRLDRPVLAPIVFPPSRRLPEPPTLLPCPECGHVLTAERGKTVVCSACNSFLGCLVPDEKGSSKWWRR